MVKREAESPEIIKRRWDFKKEQIEILANNIQKLRYNVTLGLKDTDNEKVFLTALVVAIILETSERVGNEVSASNGHAGISGLKKKQISIDGNKVTLEYTGKSGVEHVKSFSDEKIAKALKLAIKRSKTDDVFCTSDGFKIKADRILRYLSDFKIRSKDIRSIGCNKLMVDRLKNEEIPEDEKKRKKFFMQSLRKVAIKIGHGSGTLRKHYLIPELETNYIKNGNIIDISERESYEQGGEIKNENIFYLTFYRVSVESDNHSEEIYFGNDYDIAKLEYDSANISDFSSDNGGLVMFQKFTNKYKFIYELDPEFESIDDYPIEGYYNESDYYELIEDGEYEDIENRDVKPINKDSDELLMDVENHYKRIYGNYKYNRIVVSNNKDEYDDDYKEYGCIQLRIADHSENVKNIDKFGSCDYYISVVIANKNKTANKFLASVYERRSNEIELSFDSDDTFDDIISKIDENIEEGKEYILYKNNVEYFENGGELSKTPAPKKDKIYGSKINKPESAESKEKASSIILSPNVIKSIVNITHKHNEEHPETKINISTAKAVVRRGMGAYSSTHRPTISEGKPNSRVAWGLARLNAFVYKIQNGKSKSGKYNQDDDLIDELGYKVKNYSKGGSIELLAHNGKTSNLTPEQYKLVRTPEFKKWFGNWENDPENSSKVIDENGEPLVVYHGTKSEFNTFDKNKRGTNTDEGIFGKGFYFSKNINTAKAYGSYIKETFLNIRNPFNNSKFKNKSELAQHLDIDEDILTEGGTGIKAYLSYTGVFSDAIKEKGYDGVTTRFGELVVFEPNQIKIADGTNTLFDSNNPDIRFEKGGTVNNIEFKCDYEKYFEYVPLSEIEKYIEFDREVEHKISKNYLDELTKEIKVNGITYPITLEVYQGKGLIVEGNHRIAVAKRLGIEYIPVRVVERSRPIKGTIYENKFKELPSSSNITYAMVMYGIKALDFDNSAAVYGFTKVEPKFENGGEINKKDNFKKWFKGSKVVDEFGTPKIVYHGTNRKFNVFDSKEIGQGTGNFGHYGYGFYFSDDIREAKGYGDIILECYLNIKKPFNGTDEEFDLLKEAGFSGIENKVPLTIDFNDLHNKMKLVDSNAYEFMSIAKENGIDDVWSIYLESHPHPHNHKIDLNDIYDILGYTDLFNQNNAVSDYVIEELNSFGIEPKLNYGYQYSQSLHWVTDLGNNSQGFTDFIKSLGYDGVIYGSEYVAFYPNQIKLADGTNTDFDSNNPDIRFEKGGGIVNSDNFKKWFDGSKIIDDKGFPIIVYHGTNELFNKFDLSKVGSRDNNDYGMWGTGFYFSPNKKFSKAYGDKVVKLYLSIKNPFIVKKASSLPQEFKPVGGSKDKSDELRERFIKEGYDGVIQYETGDKPKITQIVAFYPSQIKLADGKNNKFDSENPDIRFEEGGEVEKITFDDFHKGTTADFKEILRAGIPKRNPDFISDSGSKYWFTANSVIRQSDHWGQLDTCVWTLDGKNGYKMSQGICNINDFKK